jgi:hypothetical protein
MFESEPSGRRLFEILAMLLLSWSGACHAATPESIQLALAQYSGPHRFVDLPELAPEDLDALSRGDAVIHVHAPLAEGAGDETASAVTYAFQVVDAPRLQTWIALLGGPGVGTEGRFTRAMLQPLADGAYVRYQHVDLPWPVQNRHWTILCEKNIAMARQSSGRIWEHHWTLLPDGPARVKDALADGRLPASLSDKLADAIYLPANRGAWILFELDLEQTLVIAYADVGLGGRVPTTLVRMFAKRQLLSGFETIRRDSGKAYAAYKAHPVVHDGFGQPILVRQPRLARSAQIGGF